MKPVPARFLVLLLLIPVLSLIMPPVTAAADDKGPTTLIYPPRTHALGHRATSSHLKMFLGRSGEFSDPRGICCVKLDAWDDPGSDSDDDELFVILANRGRGELLFNNSMTSISRFEKGEEFSLKAPFDAAADVHGNVYVTEPEEGLLIRLNLDGKNRLRCIGKMTGGPGADEQFREPRGICVSSDRNVYVTDRSRNDVFRFDADGKLLRIYEGGPAGQNGIFQPIDIDVLTADDQWNYFGRNTIYLLDMDGKRIQKLSADGEREAVRYAQDLAAGNVKLTALAADYYANVFLTDAANHRIHKLDRNLNLITSYGERGTDDGQFISPAGIAIWRRFGQVFITDSVGVQYFWIGTDIGPSPDSSRTAALVRTDDRGRRTIDVSFQLTEPSEVSISIDTAEGQNIRLIEWRKYFATIVNLTLPIKDATATDLGDAKVLIRARATYSSKQAFEKKLTLPLRVVN